MKKKVEGYKVDEAFSEKFMQCLDHENKRRDNTGERRLNKSDFLVYITNYFYDHEIDDRNRKYREEKDAQYYANITKKVTEKYYESIMGSLEAIAGGINNSSLLLRIIASKEDSLRSGTSEEKLVSKIIKDDETFRKIRSIYNARKQDEDIYEDKGSEDDGEENIRLF